jgi:hypothetical protein
MAFPSYSRTTGSSTGDTTAHTITLPGTITAGQILLLVVSIDGDPTTISFDTTGVGSWTTLYSTTGANLARAALWKVADGTEDGLTLTLNLGVTQQAAWHIFLASSAQSVEYTASGATSSSTVTYTTALTPTWGSADTLWIAATHFVDTPTVTAYSSGYSDGTRTVSTGADNTSIFSQTLQSTSATETPGTATLSASKLYVNYVFAIRPAAGSSSPSHIRPATQLKSQRATMSGS